VVIVTQPSSLTQNFEKQKAKMNDTVLQCERVSKKGSPYSITERRVLELIPVLGSQPAGDVSHKP